MPPQSQKEHNREKGNKFEDIAVKFLLSKDYEIIDRNFYSKRYGEIDIICKKDDRIIFVEVKGRTDLQYGPGELAVTRNKQKKLIKSCQYWLFSKKILETEWQIDVISILQLANSKDKVVRLKHYKNAVTAL